MLTHKCANSCNDWCPSLVLFYFILYWKNTVVLCCIFLWFTAISRLILIDTKEKWMWLLTDGCCSAIWYIRQMPPFFSVSGWAGLELQLFYTSEMSASPHHSAPFKLLTAVQLVYKNCWHVANAEQLKWTNRKRKWSVWVLECVQACTCVTVFNLALMKLNCWLCKCILLWQNMSFSNIRQPWTIFRHGPNLFLAPRSNTSRTKRCLCIEEFTIGAISNYAPGQTVINDWYFVLAQEHALWVMCLYSFSIGFLRYMQHSKWKNIFWRWHIFRAVFKFRKRVNKAEEDKPLLKSKCMYC